MTYLGFSHVFIYLTARKVAVSGHGMLSMTERTAEIRSETGEGIAQRVMSSVEWRSCEPREPADVRNREKPS